VAQWILRLDLRSPEFVGENKSRFPTGLEMAAYAEDAAVLDHIAQGRLELVLVAGLDPAIGWQTLRLLKEQVMPALSDP
jgi:hypothetical protein